ncbi:MAG: FtsW/RodA/SpoVE family cell cycle protein [Bacteroidia bacterium]
MQWLTSRTKGDMLIWMIILILSLFSLLAVYSSTGTLAYRYHAGNTEYYLFKHLMLLAFGLGVVYLAHRVNYKYYSRISQVLLWASVPLLLLTLFLGTEINDAKRWLTLPGINLTFQTSDLGKLALIMFIARMLSKKQDMIKSFSKAYLPIMGAVLLVCACIAPADLSTAMLLFLTCLILMFIGRMDVRHLLLAPAAGIIVLCIYIGIATATGSTGRIETWQSRVESFWNDDLGSYQNQQAKIAMATGGIFGKGPGNSTQRNFLPNPFSDFIFAIIIEEYGLLGGFFLILLYLLLLYRSIALVIKSPRAFGALLGVGLAFSLVIQAMVNMAVNVHLFPVTGLTLPLVSMGGTSLWFTSLSLGIILSVSRDIEINEELEQNEKMAIA